MNQKVSQKNHIFLVPILILSIFFYMLSACAKPGSTMDMDGEEESSPMLSLDQAYDETRYGARLVISYDAQSKSFNGFIENTTGEMLKQVRVEVRLLDGSELGPTKPVNLKPGEIENIHLSAGDVVFDRWTAHAEVGISRGKDHGNGEGGGEHGKNGESGGSGGGSD